MNTTSEGLESHIDKESENRARADYQPLRIRPVIVLLIGMAALRYLPSLSEHESIILILVTVLGPVLMGVGILVWWVAASRARRNERITGTLGVLIALGAATMLSHPSLVGVGTLLVAIPLGTLAFAVAAILLRNRLTFSRTWLAILAATCGFGFVTLMCSDGMWGNGTLDWHWRWQLSAEEKMLAERSTAQPLTDVGIEVDSWLASPEWPRFRGEDGLSQQHGPKLDVDWEANPPELMWKVAVGPGWSSFVVAGNLLFTQEQLDNHEAVVCYAADSGQEIWQHKIESRWYDPLGGAGPRATPTLSNGALFAQGANGQLQRLAPKTGTPIWETNVQDVADCKPPEWGFASSPLVVNSVVVVHAGDGVKIGKILAFDVETGDLKWSVASGSHSYSSPQICMLAEKQYIAVLTNSGMNLVDAESGQQVLNYEWKHQGYRALQPQVVDQDSILIPTQELGTRRLRLIETDKGLETRDLWTSRHLKPDFNDHVTHKDYVYGFDGLIMTCIDLETGERQWKGGRYGKGQVLLLADSDVLLVASETGEAVLVKADPSRHQELAKIQAIEGRTWNHPVVVEDRLYIRNSKQAACYRLPLLDQ